MEESAVGKTAFWFPGQGAQQVGMGAKFFESSAAVRELFDRAAGVLGYDLAELCFRGPQEKLNSTVYSQPALYVCGLAALQWMREQRPEVVEACDAAAGLSLGEYTALAFAEAFSFEDGLRVVQRRGEAMQRAAEATPGGMVAVLILDREQVEEICREASSAGRIWIANYLCPGNTVVSGELSACERVEQLVAERGGRATRLAVSGAFHTPLMHPADEEVARALEAVELRPPRIPVVSNVDARPHTDPGEIRELLVRQVVQPVLWEDSVRWMLEQGFDQFYELGTGSVLRGLLKRIDRKLRCECINDQAV
ncbi:MAG: [acyl-carrier-protein] S-malonyltransferase [Planctomycetota bacterium]|nr:MAG: [acyl-carrier-protein] S-malonyltransferase [Planctomycetota bacterium]